MGLYKVGYLISKSNLQFVLMKIWKDLWWKRRRRESLGYREIGSECLVRSPEVNIKTLNSKR